MARVLISFLGTGRVNKQGKSKREYESANYKIEEKEYKDETLLARAIDKHYNIDKIFFVGTLKSMWEEVYDLYTPEKLQDLDLYVEAEGKIREYNQLTNMDESEVIQNLFTANNKVTPIIIKYGINQEELDYNIKKILEIDSGLSNGDEIFIDITHSFRSLPLILMNVLYYLTDVSNKKITINKITYGMFEAKVDEITPVIDLDIINELHMNIKAAHEFNEYGNAFLFSDLLKNANKSMSVILSDFSNSKNLNHIFDLKNKILQLKGLHYDNLSSIQKLTIPKTVSDFTDRFKNAESDSQYQFEIGKWMLDKKQYSSASVALIESLITKVCELEKLKSDSLENRECAKKLIFMSDKNDRKIKKEFNGIKPENICKHRQNSCVNYRNFSAVWKDANEIRKSVSHNISINKGVKGIISDLKAHYNKSHQLIY